MTKKFYTYYLYHRPTSQRYYGVRYSKNADPSELWVTYFTTSKYVKELIEQYGKDSFDVEIRQTFDDQTKAALWEAKVLRRLNVRVNTNWINRSNGFGEYRGAHGPRTAEFKSKISDTQKKKFAKMTDEEKKQWMLNSCCAPHTYTKERSEKISQATTGVKKARTEARLKAEEARRNRTPEQKLKCGAKHRGRTWKVVNGKRVWMEKNND
jgi:hypothetical protein